MDYINKKLRDVGLKLTPQREAVIKVLVENEDDHLSAEEIYFRIKQKTPRIGLATVYRTLELLTELHIVDRISFSEDGLVLYDIRREGVNHFHSHLVCTNCGTVEEIQEDLLLEVEKSVEDKFRFLVSDHHLTFQGLCENCQEK
jgi:Fur family ferric uptake transcriptional regulator